MLLFFGSDKINYCRLYGKFTKLFLFFRIKHLQKRVRLCSYACIVSNTVPRLFLWQKSDGKGRYNCWIY
ncbi:MAG: hypothetical protein EA408_05115 [Marinilabiliales bacterium]|nr:MAG: hypothetical protein EA408_05115 [Marinilabiliales bacterium]